MAGAMLLAASCAAMATPVPPACADPSARAAGLVMVPGERSLPELAVPPAAPDGDGILLSDMAWLQGPCADGVHASRMGVIFFDDGAAFAAGQDGRFTHMPRLAGLTNFGGGPLSGEHPPMEQARFIMASNVMTTTIANEKRSLDVGLWQAADGYVVAAFTRRGGRFGAPVELLRSTRPIRSVTYFPAPDANSGRLGLVMADEAGTALVGLDWTHAALSRRLMAAE
ncbi:hypothetical protein [Massilia sp. METH4]|uniref:hypothetical protein n=1 Tax=Massilia sp. METH4 TaxID=3123041 RepID=UPI0030D35B1D